MSDSDFNLPYSKRDLTDILAEMKQQIPVITGGNWTDFQESDAGYATIKAAAALFDFNAFYVDQMAAEAFLSTCTTREAGLRIGKSLGYDPDLSHPASVSIQVNTPAYSAPVVLPANTTWQIGTYAFTCPTQVTIPAGQTLTVLNLVQGTPYLRPQTADGTAFAQYSAPRNITRLTVKVNGQEWGSIDSFSEATTTPNVYRRFEDANLGQVIMTGSGLTTTQPKAGDIIEISGVLTQGAAANNPNKGIAARLTSLIRDNDNNNISSDFSAISITPIDGGVDLESLDSIKLHAPALYAAGGGAGLERAVTRQDIDSLTRAFPGVTDCYVQGVREGAPKGYYVVTVYGANPDAVTPDFLLSVKNYLHSLGLLCVMAIVKAPIVFDIATVVEVGVVTNAKFISQGTTINQTNQAVADYFTGLRISDPIITSAVTSKIQALDTVVSASISYKVSTRANLGGTGYLSIPLLENCDLTSATLSTDNGILVLSGDLSAYNINGAFVYSNTALDSETAYVLAYKPAISNGNANVIVPKRTVCRNTSNTINVVYMND